MSFKITQIVLDDLTAANVTLKRNDIDVVLNDILVEGDSLTIVANSGFELTQIEGNKKSSAYFAASRMGVTEYQGFEIDQLDSSIATISSFKESDDFAGNYKTLTVSTIEAVAEVLYIITQNDLNELQTQNAQLLVNDIAVTLGLELFEGDEIKAVANSGYEFYFISYHIPSSVYFEVDIGGGATEYFALDLVGDNNEAFKVLEPKAKIPFDSLHIITEQVAPEVSGTNNIYIIDKSQLSQINVDRFVSDGQGGSIDYGDYILSLIELPVTIPSQLILDPESVKLGNKSLSVSTNVLNADVLPVDLGEITVVSNKGNSLDYLNKTALLHLPRTEPINIELDYVINETISIEYLIDCYTGIATINISSTKINGVIYTSEVDLGLSIPYSATAFNNALISNSNIDVGGDNGVLKPFIEILENETPLEDGLFTIPIIDESNLINQLGYVEVEKINFTVSALSDEKEMIVRFLTSGVIIK